MPALDGIRAFAVAGVMASHLFPGTPRGAVELWAQRMLQFGSSGVDLFFVLSGFLITGILYDSLQDPAYFRKFYARRALRIFPLYYGVLAAFAVFGGWPYRRELLSLGLYLQNTGLVMYGAGTHPEVARLPLVHFWTLAIEEQFYLVWPLVVFLVRDRRKLLMVTATAFILCPLLRLALVLHGVAYFPIHQSTICRADTLLAGGALALLLRGPLHDAVLRAAVWVVALGAGLVVMIDASALIPGQASHAVTVGRVFGYTAFGVMLAGLLTLCFSSEPFKALCSCKTLRWIGKYSYGIYVYHLILFDTLQGFLRRFLREHFFQSPGLGVFAAGMVVAALAIVCAYVSYNGYERHFLKLKKYFDYRPHKDTVSEEAVGRI